MTPQEQEIFETFVLRQANLTLIDYALGHDIFEKVFEKRLNRREKDYFLALAEDEEAEMLRVQKADLGPGARAKIDRLLKNARAVKEILRKG